MGLYDDWECGSCNKLFNTWRARDNHIDSTRHRYPAFECDSCSRTFGSESARFQHMSDLEHFEHECRRCGMTWPTEEQLTEHEHKTHHYCAECDRKFLSHHNLTQHLRSSKHQGQNIKCPFCKNPSATATGLTHHLESGSCSVASGLNRDTLYKFVRSKDTGGVFTKNLIGYRGSSQYEANDQSYNPCLGRYECYLCHRLFGLLSGLNQHLNSPTHQQALYHCPNRSGCGKEFKSLAAIINHLESESCGFTRFENVQRGIQSVVSGDRLITF
ncbi:hypothetical protein PG996_015773 [Apiospora saccharicola]|uniref:C2H2-type domain-containing protein n=1 Tax=Apiospora saccharicola TaxID=335842 RepID=A0ABR1TM63_9PEZI